jgi:hypothetical protein
MTLPTGPAIIKGPYQSLMIRPVGWKDHVYDLKRRKLRSTVNNDPVELTIGMPVIIVSSFENSIDFYNLVLYPGLHLIWVHSTYLECC